MSADDFFSRWSRRKQASVDESRQDASPVTPEAPSVPVAPAEALPPPTLEDVAALTHEADFRRFVAPGVDETVRRTAMKKLFTDPHFNVMDGLDIYIDDYNKFEPLPAAMLAMLEHAKPLLDPLGQLQQPVMRMLNLAPEQAEPQPDGDAQAAESETSTEAALDASGDAGDQAQHAEPQASAASADIAADGPRSDLPAPTSEDCVTPRDDHPI
ncbi:DUF3306 domain-containing protein [Noviherbaspirillum soli]|uniref:DUF3306 domain-containing protein n=1 Tax=Noviherbaspirillum soli TaxID=1064518 RepID=UPI00188D6D6F|nr:DUF3306 domain-containing protein [Noviherbaspirillum soli]